MADGYFAFADETVGVGDEGGGDEAIVVQGLGASGGGDFDGGGDVPAHVGF